MFNKIKMANPKDVTFRVIEGKPCFEKPLAIAYEGEKKPWHCNDKDLEDVAKEKFNIERFEKRQPENKGMYQVFEDETGSYYLRFYPPSEYERLEAILQHLHG